MENHNHEIIAILQEIKDITSGINKRLDTLNGSVAKHETRLGTQDVLNAQMTITQQQIVNDLSVIKTDAEDNKKFKYESRGSINTFKWLTGLIGFGTLLTLIETFLRQ